MKIMTAINDSGLFKSYFKDLKTWKAWIVLFKVLDGSKLNKEEKEIFFQHTGLHEAPKEISELFLIVGRRGGKSTFCSLLAVFYSVWGDWQKYLSKGEKAYVFVVACNLTQARIIKNYISAIFKLSPELRKMVKKEKGESILLSNKVEISIKPASWRSSRGFTTGLLILEELSFWRFEETAVLQDKEIYISLTPGMSTIENSLCVGISTPFARSGLLWEKYDKHYGKPGKVLVWRSTSWDMNLTLNEADLKEKYLDTLGEAAFGAEYGASFREDIEGFLSLELYEEAEMEEEDFMPYDSQYKYHAFCDASEGVKGGDSMTIAVSHLQSVEWSDDSYCVLDYMKEWRPPFNPKAVIGEIANICKKYHVERITQDRHAISWVASDLKPYDIRVEASALTKSEIYESFAVLMSKKVVGLLFNDRLKAQCLGLQRFLRSGGGVKIDHAQGQHDDIINSVAGAICLASVPYIAPQIQWI